MFSLISKSGLVTGSLAVLLFVVPLSYIDSFPAMSEPEEGEAQKSGTAKEKDAQTHPSPGAVEVHEEEDTELSRKRPGRTKV
jgi:hypothetical protein